MTFVLFVAIASAIVWLWNRGFSPVPLRLAALFIAIVCAYECTTLFTPRVEIPAGLCSVVYPWKAQGHPRADANTGIVTTQIVPWTRVARDAIRSGEWPLWNRCSAAGSPLLANQQTAIFHPFTLAGLFILDLGKAFTLSACLRLFTLLFFTFTFLRGNRIGTGAAFFGAVTYTFCTFHVVWLLFPLGLATMMLPVALTGAQELAQRPRVASLLLLTCALAASVLGGHPESAFWVWAVTAGYALFCTAPQWRRLPVTGLAFVAAAALTAFLWMPTVALLSRIARTPLMRSAVTNPANHGLGPEWLEMLVAPNLLGTSQSGTWTGPARHHPAVLDDYGEMASGYVGIVTIALAMAGLAFGRRRESYFFIALLLFSFFTIAEVPLWRDALRAIPIVGLTLHQRLRVVWALAVTGLAALALDSQPRRWMVRVALAIAWSLVAAVYVVAAPTAPVAWWSFAVATAAVVVVSIVPTHAALATAVTFAELFAVTYRYNPSSDPRDALPKTGSIRFMQSPGIGRIGAVAWSLLPDIPSYYGLEDVKSTDPVGDPAYKRLLHGFLHVVPSYDEIFGDASEPFVDFLNIRYVYVPPDASFSDDRFAVRYVGPDGSVFENTRVLPRYFSPARYRINANLDIAIPRLKQIRDFGAEAVVDHVPARVASAAPQLVARNEDDWRDSAPARVTVRAYRNNSTRLDVETGGWSLLASSDTNWPGWRAYIDGARQPTVTVNGAFLGCFVPPGRHVVEFRYRPEAFDRGLRLSAGALVAILAAAAYVSRRRSRPAAGG